MPSVVQISLPLTLSSAEKNSRLPKRTSPRGDDDELPANNFVVAGRPDASQLIHMMRGDDYARRMPPDRGISSVDIALVEDWILEGAKCD